MDNRKAPMTQRIQHLARTQPLGLVLYAVFGLAAVATLVNLAIALLTALVPFLPFLAAVVVLLIVSKLKRGRR